MRFATRVRKIERRPRSVRSGKVVGRGRNRSYGSTSGQRGVTRSGLTDHPRRCRRSPPWWPTQASQVAVRRSLRPGTGYPPPVQYVHPASCARFTPKVPEGMTVIPGTTFAVHSFSASSALTLALLASLLLKPRSAMLQAPKTVPFASSRSTAISSTTRTPGFGCRKGFFTAGALVSGSTILSASPILLLFPHSAVKSYRERRSAQHDNGRRCTR